MHAQWIPPQLTHRPKQLPISFEAYLRYMALLPILGIWDQNVGNSRGTYSIPSSKSKEHVRRYLGPAWLLKRHLVGVRSSRQRQDKKLWNTLHHTTVFHTKPISIHIYIYICIYNHSEADRMWLLILKKILWFISRSYSIYSRTAVPLQALKVQKSIQESGSAGRRHASPELPY